jgi:hypothetical protein
MPGVDLADQNRHSHQIARYRLGKWYKKVFLYLLDVSLVNAAIITRTIPRYENISTINFRLQLIEEMMNSLVTNFSQESTQACPEPLPPFVRVQSERLHYQIGKVQEDKDRRSWPDCYEELGREIK